MDRGLAPRVRVSAWQRPSVQRSTALLVVLYFSAAQFAFLPGALDTRGDDPTDAGSPYSLTHLVDWLQGREAGAGRSTAASAPTAPVGIEGAATADQVAAAASQALAEWQAAYPEADLSGITVGIADLPELALGETTGTSVLVDVDAAGHGWDGMDLLTVVRHEVGHALGHAHGDGLMSPTLAPGETHVVPVPESTADTSTTDTSGTDASGTDTSGTDTGATSTSTSSTTDSTSTDTTSTDTTSADTTSTDASGTDGTTGATTTDDSVTTGWTVDGATATYTAAGPLDHTLTSDGTTLSIIDAAGSADGVDLTGITTVTVLGSDGGDRLTLDLGADAPVAVTVDLGAGSDELVGPATDQRWVIDGAGSGTVTGVAFVGVEHVTGAAGNQDTFVIGAAGSITGVVAGGDGGFDVIELSGGDFDQVDFVATGPQSGTITRDGDVLTYTGMEPITSDVQTPVQTVTLTGVDDEVEIRDATAGDDEFEIVVVNGTAESVTIVNASSITELVINLGGGADILRFVAIDSLFTGTITVNGGDGDDTLHVPDVAARWDVTGVNTGTYQGVDADGENLGPSVAFSTTENLVGAPTEADAVDFGSGAGLTGTFVDGTGELTVALAGFVKVTGDFDFVHDGAYTAQVVPAGGGAATGTSASVLQFGGTSGTGFIGTDPLDTPIGLQGPLSSFGLAIVTTATQGYHIFSGTFDASFVGGDILSIPLTTMTISINDAGSDGTFLDLSGDTITAGPTTLSFSSTLVQASVTTTLSIDDFVHVSGTFTFARGGQYRVDVATGLPADLTGLAADLISAVSELPRIGVDSGIDLINDIHIANDFGTIYNLPVAVMTISVVDAAIFVGYAPNWTDDGDGDIELDELGDDAIGFFANDIDFAFAKLSPRPTEYRALNKKLPGFTAMKLSIGSIEFIGIDELTISASQLLLEVNNGKTWPGGLGPPVVNFAASFPGDPTDSDGDGEPDVPVGLLVGSLYLDFDGNQRFGISSPQVVLTLGDFVHIAGGFSFIKGPTTKVDIGTGLAAIVAEGLTALGDVAPDLKAAIDALVTSASEPGDGSLAIKDDFSMIWNVEVTTLQFGVSDVNIFIGYAPDGWTDVDGDNRIDLAEPDLDGDGWDAEKDDRDGDGEQDVDELGDAIGVYASDIDLGFVSMSPTLGSLPGFEDFLPKFFALKATADNLSLVGIPEITLTALDSVLKINRGTPWGKGKAWELPYTPRIDWAASFPDDPDGGGPATSGYVIETGGAPIIIDFGGFLLTEVSSKTVILTISDFVHISGGFSFREGPGEVVEVATGLPAGLSQALLTSLGQDNPLFQPVVTALTESGLVAATPAGDGSITVKDDFSTIWNVPVGTLQVGLSDVNVFLGYNPGWVDVDGDHRIDMAEPDLDGDGWDAETDDRDGDGTQDVDELSVDAVGLYAFDIDVGLVLMSPSVTGFAIDEHLPNFFALYASADNISLVGVPGITVSATDIVVEINNGDAWPGGLGPPVVNFEATFGGRAEAEGVDDDGDGLTGEPGGYQIDTGNDPIYINYNGNQRIGASSPEIILTLGDFVHLTGGFSFEMGPTEKVDIATGLPADVLTAADVLGFGGLVTALEGLSGLGTVTEDPTDGTMALSEDFAYLYNLEVATLQFGISDVNVFIGFGLDWTDVDGDHRIDRAEPDRDGDGWGPEDDRDGDGIQDVDEFGDSAVGLYAFDVDLGFALMTPTLKALPGFDQFLPEFYALKASADELSLIGIDAITLAAMGVRIEVNDGGNWGGTPWGGVIDWESSFDGDTDGDGIADGPVGFRVDTGNDPVYLDYPDQAILGGGADLVVIGISEFVHLRGSIYFEKGTVLSVPLVDGLLDTSVVNALVSELGLALDTDALDALNPVSGNKELEFLNIGGQDLYAFVGVGGPHWTTASGDLTDDLLFECGPGETCTDECDPDTDATDGHAAADDEATCVLTLNENAIGLAVSDLDFALALGTPTNDLDPMRYITLRASVDEAGLVGLEDLVGGNGITATVRGVEFELNMSTPTLNGIPLLPVLDWKAYALDPDGGNCTTGDLAALASGGTVGEDCEPFGVKTGRLDDQGDPVKVYFLYDSLLIRAAVEMLELDIMGVLVVRGSVAFVLGPVANVTLTDELATVVSGVTTMTIGGANIFGFIGVGGPHWLENLDGDVIYSVDTDGDGWGDGGGECDPAVVTDCEVELNPSAIGLALTDLDFGLFVGTKLSPTEPAAFIAADINLNDLSLLGVPGITATGLLAIALNLGFTISGAGASFAGINFKDSFRYDSNGDGTDDTDGFALDTGDPLSPMILDFETSFVEVQLAGSIEIRAGPSPSDAAIARLDGIFYLGIDLEAGSEEFRLLALVEMTIGPDIGASDPLLSIGALGVLILNSDGLAADFQVNLDLDVPGVELNVDARLILNTTGVDQTLVLPARLSDYIEGLEAGTFVADVPTGATVTPPSNLGPLATVLLDRLTPCVHDTSLSCYTIRGAAPDLIDGSGLSAAPNEDTIDGLFGRNGKGESDIDYLPAAAYVVVLVDGELDLLGFAKASVFGAINIGGSAFQLVADVEFVLGARESVGIVVGAKVIAEISEYGFLLNASVSVEANLLGIFDLDVAGTLAIDTRETRLDNGIEVANTPSFGLVMTGDVTVLKVLSFNTTLVFLVGGPLGSGQWAISGTVGVNLFVLGLSGSFFVSSWGSFAFQLSGSINLTIAGTGIVGTLSAHVSYCLHSPSNNASCQDDVRNWVSGGTLTPPTGAFGGAASVEAWIASLEGTEATGLADGGRTLWFSISGSVKVKVLGFTLAGFSLSIQPNNPIPLGGGSALVARGTIELFWFDIDFKIPIGYISLPSQLKNEGPPPPVLGTMSGSTLLLNVGSRGHLRGESPGVCEEIYTVWYDSSTSETVVESFGREDRFTGVTAISGDFGGCDDALTIDSSVTVPVTVTGGDGDDTLVSYGSGVATFSGNAGFDVLRGGLGNDRLDGGGDSDSIIGGWGDDVIIGGGGSDLLYGDDPLGEQVQGSRTDNDTFFGTLADLDGDEISAGTGSDRWEILATGGAEQFTVDTGTSATSAVTGDASYVPLSGVTVVSTSAVRGGGLAGSIESILIRLQGGDTVTIDGAAIRADGVTDVLVTSVSGSADSVVLQGQSAAEVVTISGGQATAPATVGGASSAVPTGSVTVTTVVSELAGGNLTLKLYNTGVGGSDADALTIQTLGGGDRVAVTGIKVDTTIVNGGGTDHVYVSSSASCTTTTCTLGGGTVDGMDAGLTVTGGGSDVLKVDDRGDGGADADVVLTASLLTGAGLHADGIAYTGLASLELLLGSGGDTVHVKSTAPLTQIRTGGGTDTVYVSSTAGIGITAPTGDLNSINGLLQLFGEAGSDVLVMSDFGEGSANQGTLDADSLTGTFSPADIEFLGFVVIRLDLGDGGGDTLGIPTTTTGATVTVNGNGGNDWFDVDAVDGGTLTINGGTGDDNVDVGSDATADAGARSDGGALSGITGDLTFDGGAPQASDWLWLDDTGNSAGNTGIVTKTTVTDFSTGDVTYTDVEHVELALGSGNDNVRVKSTNGPGATDAVSETVFTVKLGGGDDTVDVSSDAPTNGGTVNAVLGLLVIEGGSGHDEVHVADRGDTGDNTGWLTATDLWGLGMGPDGDHGIHYTGLELLDIDLGSGDDTFVVRSTHAAPTTIDTHAGDDTVDVGDFAGARDLTGIDGFLDIDTGTQVEGDRLVVNGQSQTDELVGRVTDSEVQGLATEIDSQNDAADLVQTVTITGGGGGTFTLSIDGTATIELSLNASGAEVRDALVTVLQSVHDAAITAADLLVSRTPLARTVGIVWRITYTGLLAGQVGHDLTAITVDTTDVTKLGADDVVGWVVGSSTGRIEYTSVEELEVNLGSGIDHLELTATSAATVLNAGGGNDVVDVESIAHDTLVQGQDGADTLQVNLFPETPEVNRIDAGLTLDGSDGGDVFYVQLAGTEVSFIDVIDNGTSGVDSLYVLGTAADDQFLLRTRLVALLNSVNLDGGYDFAEYVTYSAGLENLVINTLDGDDAVAFDDNTKTVATTVNLGDGKDFIQVGQLYGEECIAAHAEYEAWFALDPSLAPATPTLTCFDDRFLPPRLTDTTQGMLSNGISEATTVNGGAGNDLMIVFRNRAVLTLNGESGDDTFVIRTFLEEDSETQLDAGEGTDVISYVTNAPVNVNGGDGYDRLYVVGTEADDVFVITENGIYGAGRFISFVNIELVGLDTVEGNDYVHVQSTAPGVAVEVYGGLGSDTIEVGANLVPSVYDAATDTYSYAPVYAAADDLIGHSGLVVHNVESQSGDWSGLTVDGIAAEVADDDEAAVVILQSGGTTVVREFAGSATTYVVDTYQVLLTREPDALVRVDALVAIRTPEQEDAFAFTIEVSLDGITWVDPNGQSQTGVFLYFDADNWDEPVTVYVRAAMDTAEEFLQVTSIRHTVNGYIEGTVGAVTAIGQYAGREFTDTGAFADLDLVGRELVITGGADPALLSQGTYVVVWHDDDTVRVDRLFDPAVTAGMTYEVRGVGEYAGVVLNDLFVTVIDDDVVEVIVLETGVDTTVGEGGAEDTYTVELSAQPGTDTDVRITAPEGTCISADGGTTVVCGGVLTLTFTPTDFGPRTVTVTADLDTLVEGFQFSRIQHEVYDATDGWVAVGEVLVGTTDDDSPSVLITESDGSTVVAEGIDLTDTYTIELTAPVATDDSVTVSLEAIRTKTQYDATPFASGGRETYDEIQVELRWRRQNADGSWGTWSAWSATHAVTFTSANWAQTVEVEVRAIDDAVIDGRILQAFAEAPARVNRIQGALYVDGGVSEFGYPLDGFVPVMLPGETSSQNFVTPNPAFDVIEEHAVDTLIVHNEDDVADSDLTLTTVLAETSELSEELADHLGKDVTPSAEVSRYALLGLGMGPRGIEYLGIETLDILLGSGSDDVTVETTHTGTTTIRGHAGADEFFVEDIKGHTRILGGTGDDTVTVGDGGLLEAIDAQLLISGEDGDDTTIVDDSADDRADATDDDFGTLTQTALIGLDMDSTTADNLFSLELSDDATSFTITINATRPADLANDWPAVDLVDFQIVIDQAAINALAALGPLPYGDYSSYAGTSVLDIDAYLLAGLVQQALFARVQNAPAAADATDEGINPTTGLREFWLDGKLLYTQDPTTGAEQWYLPDGTLVGDDRFATTGCGREGTTGERDSRCANSVYVWDSGGRVFLIGFQGELAGLDIGLAITTVGTYATDLLRTDGITYDTIETLDIRLGAGNDLFNVRGTLPHTLLDTGAGDDVVFVSDAAALYEHTRPGMTDEGGTDSPEGLASALADAVDLEELHERTLHGTVKYDDRTYVGTLDEIDGKLDIDTGTGSNTLAVSDHASPNADGTTSAPFVITSSSITGLSTGQITYTAAAVGGDLAGQGAWTLLHDAGMFGRGVTVHLGTGNDTGAITSVRGGAIASSPFKATVTTVYGNLGNDVITVSTAHVAGALLVVHGDEGDDTIDGGTATLALDLFGDQGYDTLTGGSANDRIIGDDGRVYYLRPAGVVGFDVVLGGAPRAADLKNPHSAAVVAADANFQTIEVVLTRVTTIGATGATGTTATGDVLVGNGGNDILLGGAAADTIDGDAGNDLLFGDFAWLGANPVVGGGVDQTKLPLSMAVATHPFTYTSRDIADANAGNDILRGGAGNDILLGQQGSDQLFGGTGDDDLTGGHDVAGGHDAGDVLDGGSGNDVLVGDNAKVLRTGSAVTTRVRSLTGTTLVSGVTGTPRANPTGVETRSITLLDHAVGTSATLWGADIMAGGADDDVLFGQLGNDRMHGDGTATLAGVAAASDTSTDGDDYLEGNGGNDTIYGGLGQDDIIGGSSDLFGLTTPAMRPDGADTIYGGNGDRTLRNDLGGAVTGDRDADVILGDNGRIFRIVSAATGAFLRFTWDATTKIIPRAVVLLDYSPIGETGYAWVSPSADPSSPVIVTTLVGGIAANIGAGDTIHGEAGDDIAYGMTGDDVLYGDAGNDDLYGNAGADWISGGAGHDGIVADDGRIMTSRNGSTEPLHGLTSANATENLRTPGDLQTATTYVAGELHKAVELDLDIAGVNWSTFYVGWNDIAYGGLGNDFIHGGEGSDALSGGEALARYFYGNDAGTATSFDPLGYLRTTLSAYYAARDVLGWSPTTQEFRYYDEFNPRGMIFVDAADTIPFLLTVEAANGAIDDGKDTIFGDGGHDWIVGGTNYDRLFGGWGDDLLDADDDPSTPGVDDAATRATTLTYADVAYGGAGRDILIGNTGADRLIDWVGEYNSYIVPFSPYGAFAISRSNAPALRQYLLDLGRGSGMDITRGGDATRYGEPYGELGMVIQQDPQWRAQTGAPADPQAGNLQGPRDVLRSEDFTNTSSALSAFAVDSGSWSVVNNRYESVAQLNGDALSLFYVDAQLPNYFELTATVSSDKAKGGYKSNAYLIFDYQSATDFRFAGLEIGTGKVQIGHRTAAGWQVLAQGNFTLQANRNYDLVVAINGQTVTLYVDGVAVLTHTFASPLLDPSRPELGVVDPLTDGMVGVGSYSAIMRVERMSVRKLTPEITFSHTEQFDAPAGHRTESGTWTTSGGSTVGTPATTAPAVTTTSLTIAPGFRLIAEARLSTAGSAGMVFDWYAADRFKYVLLDVAGDRIVLGHYTEAGWVEDASVAVALEAGVLYDLRIVLAGDSASVLLNGVSVLSHSWFSLLNDGRVGLLAKQGSGTFDAFTLATDDPELTPAVPFVNVGDTTVVEGDSGTTTVTVDVTLSYAPTAPVTVQWETTDGTAVAGSDYQSQRGTVTFAPGQTTATITVVVLADLVQEGNENFAIVLSAPTGALLGDASGLVTITNDDVAATVAATATDTTATEGSATDVATFLVTRTGDADAPLAVTIALGGVGVLGVDYTITAPGGALSGSTLTFASGVTSITLTVVALTDTVAEGLETVVLSIVAKAHYGISGSGSATVSLLEDAVLPALSVSDAQVLEGDRGGWVDVTITLDRAATSDITVELRTYDGTATAGKDYRSYVTTLTIAAGQTSVTVAIRVLGDKVREGDEYFTVELSRPTGAVIADSRGVVTLVDDDGGRLTASSTGSGGATLDDATLAAVLADARAWWAAQGTPLGSVSVRLVDLPGATLAIATSTGVLLDLDAAGHGWGPGGMDLGTVLRHELGHLLGLGHGDGLMAPVLAAGEVHEHLTATTASLAGSVGLAATTGAATVPHSAVAGGPLSAVTVTAAPGSSVVADSVPGQLGSGAVAPEASVTHRGTVVSVAALVGDLGNRLEAPSELSPVLTTQLLPALLGSLLGLLVAAGGRTRRPLAAGDDGPSLA